MEERNTKSSFFNKAKIISLLEEKEQLTKSQLAKYLDVSRPTIYHHIETLKSQGLIQEEKSQEKQKGSPVYITLSETYFNQKPRMIKIINFVKKLDAEGLYPTRETIIKVMESDHNFDATMTLNIMEVNKYLGLSVTNQGKKFLKDFKKK